MSEPDYVTSTAAATLLGVRASSFHHLAHVRQWRFKRGPNRRKFWLREDIEAEYERRNDSPPRDGWQEAAEARRTEKPETTPRRCLRCDEEFPSRGPGNRLCCGCRVFAARVAPGDARIVPAGRK